MQETKIEGFGTALQVSAFNVSARLLDDMYSYVEGIFLSKKKKQVADLVNCLCPFHSRKKFSPTGDAQIYPYHRERFRTRPYASPTNKTTDPSGPRKTAPYSFSYKLQHYPRQVFASSREFFSSLPSLRSAVLAYG